MKYLLWKDDWLREADTEKVVVIEAPRGLAPHVPGALAVPYTGQVARRLIAEKRLQNAILSERHGYRTRDEASEYAVGQPAATDAPLEAVDAGSNEPDGVVEPGEDRVFVDSFGRRYLSSEALPAGTTFTVVRATADDVWADPSDDRSPVTEARLTEAAETWADAFEGDDVETLLEASVEGEGNDG